MFVISNSDLARTMEIISRYIEITNKSRHESTKASNDNRLARLLLRKLASKKPIETPKKSDK